MAQVDTVVPNSLNYTDIKPQAIENKIQLCRYQPTAMVTGAKGGDMIKFLLSGNGFLDPYSTYFQFNVEVPDLAANEIRFVDRSAHSFFTRIVIRSQGVELERIEQYDVIAAMINDMIYSPEQCTQHYWEGFPTHQYIPQLAKETFETSIASAVASPANFEIGQSCYSARSTDRDQLIKWLNQGSSPSIQSYVGETCFHELGVQANVIGVGQIQLNGAAFPADANVAMLPIDWTYFPDFTYYEEIVGATKYPVNGAHANGISFNPVHIGSNERVSVLYPVSFAFHENGRRVPSTTGLARDSPNFKPIGTTKMQFLIPIYSGLIGLLMPEKKLLPLNLLPLDIEIVFNPHALYSSGKDAGMSRNYRVSDFYIYGNTFFFEQEIHRTLEASVADHGLFIYCNSFHYAPLQHLANQTIPTALYISMNLKSINSVHWVFMYTHYETSPCARKLHFVSHNITKMWLLNGTQLIPQYAIEGNAGTSKNGQQLPFVVELYKAWNKMHDPARDGSLHAFNTCGDEYAGQFDPIYGYNWRDTNGLAWWGTFTPQHGLSLGSQQSVQQAVQQIVNKQGNVGRAQYGISLEGEELGSDRTMITGRKSQYPFQLQLWSSGKFTNHASYMMTFLRADFIVYIRPDLQIVTLGK